MSVERAYIRLEIHMGRPRASKCFRRGYARVAAPRQFARRCADPRIVNTGAAAPLYALTRGTRQRTYLGNPNSIPVLTKRARV